MGEDEPNNQSEDDSVPDIVVPRHSPLPPPPEMNYSRPNLKSATPGKPWERGEGPVRRFGSKPAESAPVTLGAGLAAGSVFAMSVVVGVTIGQYIDSHWVRSSVPWGTIVFVLVGVAAGFLNLMRIVSPPGGRGK